MDKKGTMKIFLSISSLNYGGASKMFLWLAESLASKKHDVTIITFTPIADNVNLSDKYQTVQLKLHKATVPFNIIKLSTILKRHNPDISVSFGLEANVYNTFACLGLKTCSVICERNDPFLSKNRALKLWKPCFKWADGAVWQLKKVHEFYNNIKTKTAVIPNPVVLDDFTCDTIEKRIDGFVTHSRLDLFQKRQDVLINAFAIFHKTHPEYKLYIYGTGPDKGVIEKLIRAKDLDDAVILKGMTAHPLQDISQYKFYILTSDFEGIPNSLIEAMSVGLPCIATDCSPGGAAFLIKDGFNGLLAKRTDPVDLYKKMSFLAENHDYAKTLGHNATSIKTEFNPKKIINMWNDYLFQVVNENTKNNKK